MNSAAFTKLLKRDASLKSSPGPNSIIVHAVLCSIQVCFSGWHVLAKVALNDGVNAVALAMAREACATILMFIIARRLDGKVELDPIHMGRILWMGLASCGNVVGCALALSHFNPMAFGVMQPSIPIFAMILSYVCGLEQMSRLKCAGVVVSVIGAVWVEFFNANLAFSRDDTLVPQASAPIGVGEGAGGEGGVRWLLTGDGGGSGGSSSGGELIGSLILFWQCLSMAALMVLQKPMLAVYPPATLTAWYYAVGSMLTMILCACFGVKAADFYFTGNWEPWIALVYAVLAGTVYTYNAYSWVLNIVSPTTATTYLTLQPVTTVILSVVFLKAAIRGHELFGGVVIAAGLIVTMYAKGLEHRGSNMALKARQERELSRVFKTPRRHRFRRSVKGGGSAELSNSDTDGASLGYDDSDHDPLLGGGPGMGKGGYDPLEATRMDGSLSRVLALV